MKQKKRVGDLRLRIADLGVQTLPLNKQIHMQTRRPNDGLGFRGITRKSSRGSMHRISGRDCVMCG